MLEELDAQERNKMSRPLEGQLYKYTNVVKGWQYRWFILIPETGILEYYMLDEVKKKRPRGAIFLAGAVVSPSDEDGQSFSINAACGEVYKLKANDAKERQFWVNRIRAVAEHQTKSIAEKNPPLPPREHRVPLSVIDLRSSAATGDAHSTWYAGFHGSSIIDAHPTKRKTARKKLNNSAQSSTVQTAASVTEALNNVKDMLRHTDMYNSTLTKIIESLPHTGHGPKCCDNNLLLLKATSSATLHTLQQCYAILQNQQVSVNFPRATVEHFPIPFDRISLNRSLSERSTTSQRSREPSVNIDPSGEVSDNDETEEKDVSVEGDRHSIIMNLMSQWKLGTDLTRVALPSFVLEPRSLLEFFADFFRHPELLVKISEALTPASRMLCVVQWYLTSFHACREATATKKPYNPILGEVFRCSWNLHENSDSTVEDSLEKLYKVTYVAEQVSHHPPVSAFYVECEKKKIALSSSISLKSNFLTSCVAVNFIGEVSLHLLTYGETYVFTFPSAYLRCMLTVPWIELGGRISVSCAATDYNASITFQMKPQQSGIPHKVTGEIKQAEELVYRISGEWNNILNFTSVDNVSETLDVQDLKRCHKHVRPLDQQDTFESRRLWQNVTKAILEENFEIATTEKLKLEELQREEERNFLSSDTEYSGKLFHKENETWKYKYPLS
ncbi:oxysterol-binding protein-related protein 11 isoform X2 [Parasteatoda tepidariorum]|uniref:oxysterol-binding protein-related protein 11 isoform X2 n=1 Tax=Parasteatoda tepidariorum TaxID=114398 RepID=UPI00077FA733|nr:oxysterol-binding protein-related protein 11 isoform X2 [Parasteatoda tepidariorum]